MTRRPAIIPLLLAIATPGVAAPACTATSGTQTTALVELYTSEGCSSCPPAETWLSAAARGRRRPQEFVPLALHVPYWDYLGWRDAFAQPAFAQRQSWLVGSNGHHTNYTPQIFVSGIDVPDWRGGAETEIRRIDAQPAAAHITLHAAQAQPGMLAIDAEATAAGSAAAPALFIAVTEDVLVSAVAAGENRGTTLRHDHVARSLLGPLSMSAGKLVQHVDVPVASGWRADHLGVAAFVQDGVSGRVLQAVSTAPCVPGR